MTREQVHDLMENELRCVQRGNYCDRDCAKCPLVKDDKELIEAYGYVIKALEQESVLDKIKAEIKSLPTNTRINWNGCCPDIDYPEIEYVDVTKNGLLSIIDKYKAENNS